jgi:hypothetical protein
MMSNSAVGYLYRRRLLSLTMTQPRTVWLDNEIFVLTIAVGLLITDLEEDPEEVSINGVIRDL